MAGTHDIGLSNKSLNIAATMRGEPKGKPSYCSGRYFVPPIYKLTISEFEQLAKYIKSNYGINLKEEKKALVVSRLSKVLAKKGCASFSEYYEYLTSDKTGKETATLIDAITTNHTYFMREKDHFVFFRDQILPYLKNNVKENDLRIWSAGCSTGEEPYTLAMILDEFYGKEKVFWNTKVLATDISSKILDIAKGGKYDNKRLVDLPNKWKLDYFRKYDEDNLIISDKIKDEVIFRKFNLMDTVFPFKQGFHVIFCRNVMIYFDMATKDRLIDKFYDCLEPGGYLFIGHSEAINRKKSRFKYVMPATYRKE